MTTLSVPLTPELAKFIEEVTKSSGLTKSDIMRQALTFYAEEQAVRKVLLADKAHLTRLLTDIPTQMGMHIITEPQVVEVGELNSKDPGGISGFVMIAESHISYHTFPKRGFVTADIYTCQNDLDTDAFTLLLCKVFGTTDYDIQVIKRGLRYPAKNNA